MTSLVIDHLEVISCNLSSFIIIRGTNDVIIHVIQCTRILSKYFILNCRSKGRSGPFQ